MKYFIITIDTEGDNLWNYHKGDIVTTENAQFIPRFQELCNKYGFIPVWLTNYEMIMSDDYVSYIKKIAENKQCEIGIHIHAWNNPPIYDLNGNYSGTPYLIEYPKDIMRAKFKATYDLIEERIGICAKSHRSGRWAMDSKYFEILEEFGILADCSYTPLVSWANNVGETIAGGSDYSKVPNNTHSIGNIIEVPVTIRNMSRFNFRGSLKQNIRKLISGNQVWLRPAINSTDDMMQLIDRVSDENDTDYLEFMMHSSELMPGGSPYFRDDKAIDKMYQSVERIFSYVCKKGYTGISLEEYARQHQA